MFSQTSEYTLRVVVFLARLRGKPATNRQIAAATRVPEGYLAKILQSLSRARLVRSQRGLRGGSSLTRKPDQITVYEVMEVASPMPRIRQCPLGLPSHGTHLCPLHRKLDDAMAMVENAFRATVITELIDRSDSEIQLGDLGDDPEAARRAAELAFPVKPIPLGLASHGTHLCPLHRKLDDAMAMVEDAFRATMITELIDESDSEIQLGDLGDDPEAARRAAELAFPVKPVPLGLPRKRTAAGARSRKPSRSRDE